MLFRVKKQDLLPVFSLGQATGVKNIHAKRVKNTQAKRLAKHKKTAGCEAGGLSNIGGLAYSPPSSVANTAR